MADETSSATTSAFSPLSGGYLLIVLSEPHSEQHKQVLLEHLAKGLASWDSVGTQIDIESELRNIATQCPNGEEVRNGEKLIQLASDSLVTEILIQPQLSTLKQCMRNLLASFTRHRHVIHAGYTLSGPGSWILQDGTYECGDFLHIVQDPEIQRLYRAYESSITMDLHCADEGQWSAEQINQELAIKAAKISINPPGRLSASESQSQQDAVNSFIRYISDILPSVTLDHLLEPSDVVGNIRFNHPTLYVFPGGQGDSALFGISGFNILVDGGFGRKPCFWDFTRHLDRLDAVVMTRSNASSLSGLTGAICRKASSPVYPQMGHIFCNLPRDGEIDLNDIDQADSTSESLTVNINDLCRAMSTGLGALQLKAQPIYRSATLEPINLYHKVGHGTLDMFIISPSANSPEVKELMRLWRSGDVSTAFRTVKMGGKEFRIPLLDIVSVCALLVWQPADPNEAVTRLLFPGSAPQHKILEGLEKFKQLEFLKSPVFMAKDMAPAPSSAVITPSSTSSAFTKSPVKTKSSTSSSPRHTPIEPVPVKAAVRKEQVSSSSSKPPPKSSDHSGSSNAKETDAKPPSRPATKIIKADVLSSSSSRTGSAELRAKKTETAKPTAPIKLSSTTTTTTTKKETATSNGESNKPLVPKIKKDVANMKMVEARVHSFKSPASLKRAEESTKNKKPTDDKDIKDKVQRSQSQSREKRSASSVRGQPDEEKTRVKLIKKIEASPASPAKTMTKPLIKAKPKETVSKPVESKATALAKEPLKKDKTSTAAKTKSTAPASASKESASAKAASKAPAPTSSSSSSTPSGKAVKRPVKAAAAAAAAIGAAATVVAVASVVTSEEQPTEEPTEVAVVEEDFSAAEAPQAASSPKHDASPSGEDDQVTDETNIIESIESQILEDVEAIEQQSQHESEPDAAGNVEDETEQEKQEEEEEQEQEQEDDQGGDQGSMAGDAVADAEEAEENAEKEDDVVETEAEAEEEEEIAQVEDGEDEGTGSEEMEVADVAVSEEVVQTEDAEAEEDAAAGTTEEAETAVTDEVTQVVEEVTTAEEVTEEEEIKEKVDDEEEEKEEADGPETVEQEEVVEEKTNKDVTEETDDLTEDKKPEEEVDDVVEENEKQEEDDDAAPPVQDKEEEMANEPIEVASIDDEVAVDVAQVDRSNDQDDNLETDENREPIEEEEIQPAVTTSSVDAGRPKSASPQPVVTGDETAIIEDDIIDQSEQPHNLDAVQQQDIQKEEEIQAEKELQEETNEDKDVVDDKEELHRPIISPEPAVEVEEELQAAVSSKPVETGRQTTSVSPLAHEDNHENQEEDLEEEEIDREKEVEEEKEMDNQEEESSSIECQTIDKELDQEDNKHPVAIDCPEKEEDTEEIPTKENDNLIISGHVDVEKKVDDVDQHAHDGQHEIEKRQTQNELTVVETIAGHHQEDALSSLSSLSDLEPTPVHDRSGASLYEEEQQLSSMESQPETHQFTQKSAPQMDEASPKDVQTKSSLVVVDDVPSGPSSVEVEEEFKAEIVVRPVPISVPLGLVDFVAPQEPTPSPPIVKSPVKDVPTPLVLKREEEEEDDGVEVEEEAFHQEIKTKDSAVPITPVDEDQGAHSFNYDEPQRQNEDLPSSLPSNSDVTKKEESTVDGSTSSSSSLSKEAEADEFRSTIDKQYAGFMNVPATEEKSSTKTPEEKPSSTEKSVDTKLPEEKCVVAEPVVVEKKTAEAKISSPLEVVAVAAVEEKKSEEVEKTTSEVKPSAEKVEELEEEEPVVEEVVSKVIDNKSVKAERTEESNVKEIVKSPETKPLQDESDILQMIVGDIVSEKVEISTTDDDLKSVKVSVDSEVAKTSEHIVESLQAPPVDLESTQTTKEADDSPPKSPEKSLVEQVKSFVDDVVKSSFTVEDVQVSKMDIKPVESEKKEEKVLLEETSKEVFKKDEQLSIAVHAESHPIEDVEKKDDVKDSVPDVPIQTRDNKSIKVDDDEDDDIVDEKKILVAEEEVIQKKVDAVEKVNEQAKEKDLIEKADEEPSVPLFEKCDKYAKTEKETVLSAVIEPIIQQSTSETVVLSAEVKSQRSSTSEAAAPMEIECDIHERKYSDTISVSSTTSLEKDVIVDSSLVSEMKAAMNETEMKTAAASDEPITDCIVDPVFVAPITASSPIDGPELLKELTFPQGLPSKCETVSSPKSLVEEIKETIQDVKEVALDFKLKTNQQPEIDTLPKDKEVENVDKQILTDVKETSKSELDCSSKSQVEEVKEIIHADVKADTLLFESASKSETVCHYESHQVGEKVSETVADVSKVSVEMKFDVDLPKSKVEEVKEIVCEDVRKASLEMTPKFESDDLHKTQVDEIKEIIQSDVKKTEELASKCESVQETLVQQVKDMSFELSPKTEIKESSPKVEQVKEDVMEDVKKASADLASKQEIDDHSHHVEQVKEMIHDVKETSKIVTESLSTKLETKVEVKSVTPEPEVIPQATLQLKCDPLANLPVVELVETSSKNVVEEVKPKSSGDLPIKLDDVVDKKTEQLKPETIDCSNVSASSSASVTPKTPLSPNIARRDVIESKSSVPAALESFSAPPPTRFEDDDIVRDMSQPSSLDSMEVHSNSSTSWAGAEKQHDEEEEEEDDDDDGSAAAMSLTPTINYLAAGYEGVNISTTSKLSTIASSDGEADGSAQPPSLDSNWSSKTFDKLTLAAESSSVRHQPEESAFSSGPSSWDDREPTVRPNYYVVSESISDRSATSSIISHATDDDYPPAEKLDRSSLVSVSSSELNIKKEMNAPVSPVPSSPFSTDRCSSHGDFEANKDSLSSIQTSESSSDYHLETKVDDSASAISSTRSDYSDDRSGGSSIDPSLLQQQRLEPRSLTPRSDISCSSETTEPVTTSNTTTTTTATTQLIQPGQQQTPVELKASSKAELADPKLAPHNIWLKEKDTASSPNPFTDQYADDDTDHSEPLASSTLYYQQPQQPLPVLQQQHLQQQQQHLSDFDSDRHSDSQSSSVPVAEYTDEYYAQHLEYVETSQKSLHHPHADEVSDQEAYLYESEHDDADHHYHPYSTKYSDSYDEADLYPTEEAINDDYRHIGDHQNGNSYHYYESSESATTDVAHDGNLHGQYEDLNRNDRTPTRDVQHPYVAPDVYETQPPVISPTTRPLDVTTAATASSSSSSRDERVVLPQTSSVVPSPQQQLSPQQQQQQQQQQQHQQQQHEETLASWGKPLGLPAPVAPGVVFSSNGTNGSPLKRPATATTNNNGHKASDKVTNGANNAASSSTPFYVDLAYIPHHSDPRYSDVDFFKRIRARHYVLSTLEPSAQVLDALLEGKQSWTGDDKDLDVTIIPTYDSDALATWVSANEDLLARNRIDLAPSASRCTINLQDHETSCSAYRLEF